jgi:hypothetical protein
MPIPSNFLSFKLTALYFLFIERLHSEKFSHDELPIYKKDKRINCDTSNFILYFRLSSAQHQLL